MSATKVIPLRDVMDNSGKATGYSVDTDGTIVDTSDCPFPFFEEEKEVYYKIYNDGGHYVATPYFRSYGKRRNELSPLEKVFNMLYDDAYYKQRKREKAQGKPCSAFKEDSFIKGVLPVLRARFPQHGVDENVIRDLIRRKRLRLKPEKKATKKAGLDIAFDSLYEHALRTGLKGAEITESVKNGLLKLFADIPDLDNYIANKLEKKMRALYSRKKRFRRKAALNRWNYFVTFTYDDKKHTPESFRKKLRKCLSNLHTRRGWRYMGVFENAPDTGRLHFHGLLYVPYGQMVGAITERQDYSTAQGKMQITYSNNFFADSFGRNDFEELSEMELKRGNTLNYLLKYIGKTGERIVYSRGIPTEICKKISVKEIVGKMKDFVTKFVLFDDTIDWERDILHYTHYKQMTIIDLLCNPPQVA